MGRGGNLLYDKLNQRSDTSEHFQQVELDLMNLPSEQYFQALLKEIKQYYPNPPQIVNRLIAESVKRYLKANRFNDQENTAPLNKHLNKILEDNPSSIPENFYMVAALFSLDEKDLKKYCPDFSIFRLSSEQVDYLNFLNNNNQLKDAQQIVSLLVNQSKEVLFDQKFKERVNENIILLTETKIIEKQYKMNFNNIFDKEKINYKEVLFPLEYCYHEIRETEASLISRIINSQQLRQSLEEDYLEQQGKKLSETQLIFLQKSLLLSKNGLDLSISLVETTDL
jgi:hypothetical protein